MQISFIAACAKKTSILKVFINTLINHACRKVMLLPTSKTSYYFSMLIMHYQVLDHDAQCFIPSNVHVKPLYSNSSVHIMFVIVLNDTRHINIDN